MADNADLPMNNPDAAKPFWKSKTIWLMIAGSLVGIIRDIARVNPDFEWAAEPLNQLQILLLGGGIAARATAAGPLK